MGWLTGWDKRVKLTIDSGDITAALSNFPVLVYLSTASGRDLDDVTCVFDEVGANSLKIAVTESDGTTECYVEVEKWDFGNEEAWLWVKVPSVTHDVDTELYLYYDNAHADNVAHVGVPDSVPAENVWDANFKLVTHMRDDPDTSHVRDSTTEDHDGTKRAAANPVVTAAGKIDDAQDFSSDHIGCGDLGIGNTYTAECWIKADTLTGSGDYDTYGFTVMASAASYGLGYPLWLTVRGTEVRLWAYETTAEGGHRETTGAGLNTADQFHVAAIATKSGATKVYVNGVEKLSFTNDGDVNWTNIFTIGDLRPARAIFFDGIIDEVRISNSIRVPAWIETSYESGRDDLLSFGSEECMVIIERFQEEGADFEETKFGATWGT